jgi:flagellar biosynthetic protein FlhB
MWTPKALTPKPERISPLAGVKRLLSAQTLAELVRSLVKLALVGWLVLALGRAAAGPILGAVELSVAGFLALLVDLGWRLFLALAVGTAVLAALDFLWQWHSLRSQLRMSRREIVEEHKHTEGDPLIKQRLRGLRLARARRRMLAEVPKATVVITNPTHFAVALRYDPQTAPVPVLIAKGTDRVAARIREAALAHGVPLVENPPLARLLHATVELGRAIPKAHYEAVAEVIGYVLRLRERAARRRPMA